MVLADWPADDSLANYLTQVDNEVDTRAFALSNVLAPSETCRERNASPNKWTAQGKGGRNMLIKFQIIIGILSLVLLLVTFELIRKGRLREEYSILWLFTGGVTLVFSFWPQFFLSQFLTRITGLYYLSTVVVIAFLFLLLIVLHFSVVVSKLTDRNKELAQRHALLELDFKEFKRRYLPPDAVSP